MSYENWNDALNNMIHISRTPNTTATTYASNADHYVSDNDYLKTMMEYAELAKRRQIEEEARQSAIRYQLNIGNDDYVRFAENPLDFVQWWMDDDIVLDAKKDIVPEELFDMEK